MARAVQTVPEWAIGCMDRDYIRIGGAARDSSIAIWVQTESQYIDLRIPHDRPSFRGRRSLADFSPRELLELGRQSGDTGTCTIRNRVATWRSWSDRFGFFCDDVALFPDDGRLDPHGSVVFEFATPKSPFAYEEAWLRQPYDHGLVAHLTLRTQVKPREVLGVLLVTGRHAGFVERCVGRSRASLETRLMRAKGDVARMRRILDCEASYAVRPRAGAPYVVRHSNLPFREGRVLDVPRMDRRVLDRARQLPARRAGAVWRVESWFVKAA